MRFLSKLLGRSKRHRMMHLYRYAQHVFVVLCLLVAFMLISCTPSPSHLQTTVLNKTKLQEIKNKPIAIVSFSASPKLDTWTGSPGIYKGDLGTRLIERLISAQFQGMVDIFSGNLRLIGHTTYQHVRDRIRPEQTEQIARAIQDANAEFGIVVHSQFGWEWNSIKLGVANYRFKTVTTIHDIQGAVVWKAIFGFVVEPSAKRLLSGGGTKLVMEVVCAAAAQAPPLETIVTHHEIVFVTYPRYILMLIEDDLAGRTHEQPYKRLDNADFLVYNISEGDWPSD